MKFNIISYAFLGNQQIYKTSTEKLVGGAEVYLYDLSQFLLSLGHQVKIIQGGEKEEKFDFHNIQIQRIKLPGICRKIGFIPENFYEFNWLWKKYLDKDADRVHLHHMQHAWPLASSDMTATYHGVDWDIPKKEYLRYSAEIYPTPHKYFLKPFYSVNRFMNKKVFSRYAITKLSKIASVDSFLLRYVQSEFPDYRNKIEVIYNYVNTEIFKPMPLNSLLKNKYKDRFVVLFPRNFSINRGVHYAIEAIKVVVKKYPEVLLIMAGDGVAKQFILIKAKEFKLENNIEIVGHIDHFTELPTYYNIADIVIIPTAYSEGTSLSCLEAMATGKPVITTNVGGLYDIIKNHENGIMINPSSNELSESIIYLIENSSERQRFGNSALATIHQSFTKSIWENKYKKFFTL